MKQINRQENQKIEWTIGQHINDFAHKLVNLANKDWKQVIGTFNGIDLVVNPDSTVNDILQYFKQESKKIAEEYRKSPEGIKAAQESEQKRQNMQKKVDQLIEELDNFNFSNYESILDWICNFQKVSDYTWVSFDKSQVISKFKNQGFDIGVNTENDFNGEDAENFAKYLVGQALDGIKHVGAPHPIINKFVKDWKQKFWKEQQAKGEKIEELKGKL